MKEQILSILKKEDRLMSSLEILNELAKNSNTIVDTKTLENILKELCESEILSTIPTSQGNKYCYIEKQIVPKKKTVKKNAELKKIVKKKSIITSLILVVLVGLMVIGIGHDIPWLAIMGVIFFFGGNIAITIIAGPFKKVVKSFDNWTDANTPGPDASFGESLGGFGNNISGHIIYSLIFFVFLLFGFVFGSITLRKLDKIRKDLKD